MVLLMASPLATIAASRMKTSPRSWGASSGILGKMMNRATAT